MFVRTMNWLLCSCRSGFRFIHYVDGHCYLIKRFRLTFPAGLLAAVLKQEHNASKVSV